MNLQKLAENLGLDEDEFMEMLDLFFESGGGDLKKLEAAVAAGDAGRAHAASHSLKGSAGSLGLVLIYEQTILVDDKVRCGLLDGVADMVKNLRREYENLVSAAEEVRRLP